MDDSTQPVEMQDTPDFARGLYVCDKPGHEFASVGSSGVLVSLIMTQGFAMLFLLPVVVYFVLRDIVGAADLVAILVAVGLGALIIFAGIMLLTRVNRANYKGGQYIKSQTDSRYRVRAVIPKKRQTVRVMRWAEAAITAELGEEAPMNAAELETIRGGFDPIVVRPWFGFKRDKRFWWTAVPMGLLSAAVLLGLLSLLMGGWSGVLKSSGFMGYALTGAGMVGGLLSAELMWPIYMRLVPGRIDFFSYGLLGSGTPTVETHDLKTQGVCADFGTYTMALEPARPVGEPLPALVQAKRWPHGQALPEDYQPRYVCVALVPGRREIAQRVIQAARTDEPTPVVSVTELGG